VKTFYEWYVKELKREGGNPIDNKQMLAKYVSSRLLKQIRHGATPKNMTRIISSMRRILMRAGKFPRQKPSLRGTRLL
jgi:hypothetical protein